MNNPDITEVLPGELYVGNIESRNRDILATFPAITAIINLAWGEREFEKHELPARRAFWSPYRGIDELAIIVRDREDADLYRYFIPCIRFIRDHLSHSENPGATLVHCYAGYSRSPTIVCAYIMCKYQCNVDSVLEQLRKTRDVQPNRGFVDQLWRWEEHIAKVLEWLEDEGEDPSDDAFLEQIIDYRRGIRL